VTHDAEAAIAGLDWQGFEALRDIEIKN